MLPIMTVTIVESVPNPLHQLVSEHQVELILTASIAIAALVLSAYNAHINHVRISRSEQIKLSREVWVRINEKYDPIIEIMRSEDQSRFTEDRWNMLRPLAWDIDYFAFLIITGEIKDETLVSYYRLALSGYIEAIMRDYATADDRESLRNEYRHFNRLINEWNINVPIER
jgi:hypothetical protein